MLMNTSQSRISFAPGSAEPCPGRYAAKISRNRSVTNTAGAGLPAAPLAPTLRWMCALSSTNTGKVHRPRWGTAAGREVSDRALVHFVPGEDDNQIGPPPIAL